VGSFRRAAVGVRVPATSANLGPGFDSLGLALDICDELIAMVTDDPGVVVQVEGEGAGRVPLDDRHLVARAMSTAFDALGERPPGLLLRCRNAIPHGRGLGSSAAAIVGGLVLARALVDGGEDSLDDAALLALATTMEGHPDNVAAALHGGFTIAWGRAGEEVGAVRRDPPPDVLPVVAVPPHTVETARARGLLRAEVPHADAAFNVARTALLVHAMTADPTLLLEATDDRLHQRDRAVAYPDSFDFVQMLRGRGIPAVVSGSGPTVLALADAVSASAVHAAAPAGWAVVTPGVRLQGATVFAPAGLG
jgi:homoserine kinase